MTITGELRNWRRKHVGDYTYFWGNIYGDTKGRFYDGRHIHTSYVRNIDNLSDRLIVHTANSVYLLMKSEEAKD
jgi:hypothetical protein